MFNKKIVLFILTLLMLCALLCACANQTSSQAVPQASATESTASTPEISPVPAATIKPEETPVPKKTIAPEPALTETADSSVSADWTDCQFSFDGATYTLPHNYRDFSGNGWTFDLADYGFDSGYVMNKGDMTYSTISLENSSYSEQLSVSVGFINTQNDATDITECSIWSFECNSRYGFDPLDNVPDMMLSNGITWGSTEADVIAAYGEPDDIYDASAEYGYKVFTYESDNIYFKLNIFSNGGVSLFSLQIYC